MVEKTMCPHCHKMNDINKFCVYCGKQLFSDDEEIKLITDNPEPYCLNCGRPVKEGQTKCACGYKFEDIKCPECETENEYINRFCTSCGKKLWRSNVYDYIYDESLFEPHLLKRRLPHALRNISAYKRNECDVIKPSPGNSDLITYSLEKLKSMKLEVDRNLYEIRSRWKVVSPNYCINCLGIIKPNEYSCTKCGSNFAGDKKRVEYLKNEKNNYVEPIFDMADLKFAFKFNKHYLGSLAPSIGESQLEYRERLKWEFAENIIHKKNINKAMSYKSKSKPVKTVPQYSDTEYKGEWELYGMTEDAWEIMMLEQLEENKREIEERIERGDTFL